MKKHQNDRSSTLNKIQENLERANSRAESEQGALAILEDKNRRMTQQQKAKVDFQLQNVRQERLEEENRNKKVVEEKLYQMGLELAKEKKARSDASIMHEQTFGDRFDYLKE